MSGRKSDDAKIWAVLEFTKFELVSRRCRTQRPNNLSGLNRQLNKQHQPVRGPIAFAYNI